MKSKGGMVMKKFISIMLSVLLVFSCGAFAYAEEALPGIVNVADFVQPGTGEDVYAAVQNVIDTNPNRTIWFPDGEYILSQSLCTPADPTKSVELRLANYAVLKASDDFGGTAVVRLGGKDAYNTTMINGSNYSLIGGIIDGNNIADGISIDSGRETKVQNTSIKHTVVGLHIKYGANSGSSDCDISDINIIGNGTKNAVGILLEGYDNTITNVRIGYVYIGVYIKSAGNAMTNIHPLYQIGWGDNYKGSCGFVDEGNNNLYTYCYSDQFETCFKIIGNGRNVYDDCFGMWWSHEGGTGVGFCSEGSKFNSIVNDCRIDFRGDMDNTVYDGPVIGDGQFNNFMFNEENVNADIRYKAFTDDGAVRPAKNLLDRIKSFFIVLINFFEAIFSIG